MKLSAIEISAIAGKIEFAGVVYSPESFETKFWRADKFDTNLSAVGFRRLCGELNDGTPPAAQFKIEKNGVSGTVYC